MNTTTAAQPAKLKLLLEITWWIITAVIIGLVLVPILQGDVDFPFYWSNILFAVVFITLSRYIFQLKHTWLAEIQWFKVVLFFCCIPLLAFLVNQLHEFQIFLDTEGTDRFFETAVDPEGGTAALFYYIRAEMVFFGAGSIVVTVMFALRMLVSVWTLRNRGYA